MRSVGIISLIEDMRPQEGLYSPGRPVNDVVTFTGPVLDPWCGDGDFLVSCLEERMEKAERECLGDRTVYENLALLSLASLYGLALLPSLTRKCAMRLYTHFVTRYSSFSAQFDDYAVRNDVLRSAQTVIAANVVQGDWSTKLRADGLPVILSEWRVLRSRRWKNIDVARIEHSLEELTSEPFAFFRQIRRREETTGDVEHSQMTFFVPSDGEEFSEDARAENCAPEGGRNREVFDVRKNGGRIRYAVARLVDVGREVREKM